MPGNTVRLVAICLLTQVVIAGFVAPMGLLSGPMSEQLDISIAAAGAQFT